MKKIFALTLAVLMIGFGVNLTYAQPAADEGETQIQIKNETKTIVPASGVPEYRVYGRVQTIGFAQSLKDYFAKNNRVYLFMKQARLGVDGTYEGVKFNVQTAMGGEELLATGTGIGLSLLDMYADVPVTEEFGVTVGQFRVPFGRELLMDEGSNLFAEYSLQYGGFKLGRDVGLMVHAKSGLFTGMIGVFTGGGRDVPTRYIPQNLGLPMVAVRAGINNGLDEEFISLDQSRFQPKKGFAAYVNALRTKDSKVGHSTVLNVKLVDKSLLTNANWNPYIGLNTAASPMDQGTLTQVGADAAYRTDINENVMFYTEAEANYGIFENRYGHVELFSGRVLASVYVQPVELGIRYSFLRPDDNFGYAFVPTTPANSPRKVTKLVQKDFIHEVVLGGSYYLKNNLLKLTVDLPILFNAPVLNEDKIGAYVITEQPDQVTYVGTKPTSRLEQQTVVEARMQLQLEF